MEITSDRKVTAVCLRSRANESEVLVFRHPLDEGGFNVQLPAGTVEHDEAPEIAVVRELLEETGVTAGLPLLAGVMDEDWQGEARRRWVYLLDAPDGLQDEWPFECDCGVPITCYWVPLETAQVVEPQQPWLNIARSASVRPLSSM